LIGTCGLKGLREAGDELFFSVSVVEEREKGFPSISGT